MKLMTVNDVADLFCATPSWVWKTLHADPDFPRPLKISHRVTRWRAEEVFEYIEAVSAKRGAA